MVQSASPLVLFPTSSQHEQLLGHRHLAIKEVLVLSRVNFLMQVLSQLLTASVVTDILHGHHSSSRHQYKSCWQAFQRLVASCPITYNYDQGQCFPIPLVSFL